MLLIFFALQTVALIALNMTVEQRYFTTSLYALLILFGVGLCALQIPAKSGVILLGIYAITTFVFAFPRMQHLSLRAHYVQDTLTKMGNWLHENSPADSITYLEPLGYVGYYADRVTIDEVGLISPRVTELKRQQFDSFMIPVILEVDYVILHCDDAKRAPEGFPYARVAARFDPLDFESGKPWIDPVVQRSACYQINAQ
jgi:multisubunit Na+/H+ antiporter MnhG subunit